MLYQTLKNSAHFSQPTGAKSLLMMVLLFMFVPKSIAHEGPPFPIIVDHEIQGHLVSVWTDPDIGTGTFYIVFEPIPNKAQTDLSSVKVGVTPQSGRLEEAVYKAELQPTRNGLRYIVEVQFDRGEMWDVRVLIEGDGWNEELNSEVEATPDGSIGPIAVVIYALPFVGIGIIWIRAIMRRRETA